jgi:hypothetical protein
MGKCCLLLWIPQVWGWGDLRLQLGFSYRNRMQLWPGVKTALSPPINSPENESVFQRTLSLPLSCPQHLEFHSSGRVFRELALLSSYVGDPL